MTANLRGALMRLNRTWSLFEHRGKNMTKKQVRALLVYGIAKGYEHTGEFRDEEVDEIIKVKK